MALMALTYFAGTTLLSYLLRPKLDEPEAAGLEDLDIPTATERRKVPIVWGTVKLDAPNTGWHGDLRTDEIKDPIAFAEDPVIGFKYHLGMQLALCRGPLDELRKIWNDDQIVFDTVLSASGTDTIIEPMLWGGEGLGENGGLVGTIEYHNGAKDQAVDAYLVTQQGGANTTPAYRGTAYVTWKGPSTGTKHTFPHWPPEFYTDVNGNVRVAFGSYRDGYIGTQPTPKPWSFEVRRVPNGLGLTPNDHIVGGGANLANVLYEIMTDEDWGAGLPAGSIDTARFITAAATFVSEENGWSAVMENPAELGNIVREIEKQGDCFVFFNRNTGLWDINLIRGGYSIPGLPLLDKTNVSIAEWKKPLWDDTKNQIFVDFTMYDATTRNWKETSAGAGDLANFTVQGTFESENVEFMGCREPHLANALAWRHLRTKAYPLRFGVLVSDRTGWNLNPGDVARLTWDFEDGTSVTDLPVRINMVRLGEVDKNEIRIDVVEDIFRFEEGAFDDPPDSAWEEPIIVPDAIPTDEDIIMEMPRAIALRSTSPDTLDRIVCGGRDQNEGATSIRVYTRHAAGSPAGDYGPDITAAGWSAIGELNAALDQDTANPTAAGTEDIQVDPGDDTVALILTKFEKLLATVGDLGQSLINLILIDDEIMAVTEVVDGTTFLTLKSVYRGFLDTVPAPHAINAKVFTFTIANGVTSYPRTHNVDVQLRPWASSGETAQADANTVQITLADRGRAPYPTTAMEQNGTLYDQGTVSLDDTTSGSGLDQVGVNIDASLRDRDVFDQVQSITAGLADDTTYDTNVQIRVTKDPSTTPVLLFSTAMVDADQTNFPLLASRTVILANNAGVVPSELRIETILEHTVPDPDGGSPITINDVHHDTWEGDTASATLAGLDVHGVLDDTDVGTFTADATDTYTFTIGTSVLSSGVLEAENATAGGGYGTVIATSGTTGTLAGVTAGDTINFRHTQASGGQITTLLIDHSGTDEGFAILQT